jgi:5-methylcytosine-specific restriction enzyme subunit McrC
MKTKNKSFTLIEHSYIYAEKDVDRAKQDESNNIAVAPKVFAEIENFVLKNSSETEDVVASFLVPSYKPGIGKTLKAKNYVGVIQTKKGITIEILPKIHGVNANGGNEEAITQTKKIFLKMLKTLKNSNFKVSNFANLDLTSMPLLDIFINMFLDELNILVKQGLRKSYITKSEDLYTFKGKLDFNQNIRYNLVHKERFFVNHDEFNVNRPENKLIKSTLLLVQRKAKINSTQQRIRKFLFIFDSVTASKNIDLDFIKCKSNRLTLHYDKLLVWCQIFLKYKTFNNYKGNDLAFALLFPMEKIFEDYVAHLLRKNSDSNIKTQDRIGYLLQDENGNKKYEMKPDIVFTNKNITIIADTKWKILDEDHKLSQVDLYQMFAYGKHPNNYKKNIQKIILIYPKSENFSKAILYKFCDDLELLIFPFDLQEKDNWTQITNCSRLTIIPK